jgi:hypothetical protein
MPKPTSNKEFVLVSCRFPPELFGWIRGEAEARAFSVNEMVRRTLDDVRQVYGLPKEIVDTLNADRVNMGLDWREYVMQVLALRYKHLAVASPKTKP